MKEPGSFQSQMRSRDSFCGTFWIICAETLTEMKIASTGFGGRVGASSRAAFSKFQNCFRIVLVGKLVKASSNEEILKLNLFYS